MLLSVILSPPLIRRQHVIVAQPKPFSEIQSFVNQYSRILVAGCGTCVAVCLSGGEKEAAILSAQLRLSAVKKGKDVEVAAATVERQCDREFLSLLHDRVAEVDAVISLACGAGIQFLAEMYPETPVFPGVDTSFIGVAEGAGVWAERCKSCNQCFLGITGGICPVTMCAKSLLNGPCGGPTNGKCETDSERDCAWVQIIQRLQLQGRLDMLESVVPPRDFGRSSHPGKIVRPDYQKRFSTE
jgi:ferredoxin